MIFWTLHWINSPKLWELQKQLLTFLSSIFLNHDNGSFFSHLSFNRQKQDLIIIILSLITLPILLPPSPNSPVLLPVGVRLVWRVQVPDGAGTTFSRRANHFLSGGHLQQWVGGRNQFRARRKSPFSCHQRLWSKLRRSCCSRCSSAIAVPCENRQACYHNQ